MNKERIIPFEEKIALGFPRGSDTGFHFETVESVFKMMGKSPCNYRMISVARVHHMARNEIISEFLKSDMNYLLFIDSDMIWESNSLEIAYQLIQHQMVDIVTGIYYMKGRPHLPVIKKLDLQSGCWNNFMDWGNEPFEVDGAGLGFMLIPRYVLEKMKQPMCTWDGGFSEDLNFCLKAKLHHGFRIWAHPHIKLGHIASKVVTSFDWVQEHKPSVESYMRERMVMTTRYLEAEYPNWRKTLGIHPLDFKNINTAKHWDEIYKQTGGAWKTHPQKYDHVSKELLKGIKPDAKVLEIGCGVGMFATSLMKDHPEFDYHGIDISKVAVDTIQKKGFKAEVKKVPPLGTKDKYDVILALELLEHLDDGPRLELIKEISGSLKPDGIAIFTVPDDIMPPEKIIEHRVVYNMKSFTKFLSKAFGSVEVESFLTSVFSRNEIGKANFLVAVCKEGKK